MENIANIAGTLARAQESLGHNAKVLVRKGSRWPGDVVLPTRGHPLTWNLAVLSRWRLFANADVIHIHGGIWTSQLAFGLLRRVLRGKVFVVHLHGSETRTGLGLHHLGWADAIVCATPDLLELVPSARWIPHPVPLPARAGPPSASGRPIFAHFPTSRKLKGTSTIVEAFRALGGPSLRTSREPGIEKLVAEVAEFWIVEGVPHDRALELMSRCDVVIDHVTRHGTYGVVSAEGMAQGKVVVASVDPALHPGVPIVRATPENLVSVIRELLARRAEWAAIGARGRECAARIHDPAAVAGKHLRLYYDLQSREPWTRERATRFWLERGRGYAQEFHKRRGSPQADQFRDQEAGLRGVLAGLAFRDFVEVGAGFGRVTGLLVEQAGVRGVASDLSVEQLREARRNLAGKGVPVVRASATALPFRDGSADLVIASEVLMHLPPGDMHRSLEEMARVARKHVVTLDWYEPYALGAAIPWCWNHDYPAAYRGVGLQVKESLPYPRSLQSVFVATR